MRSVACKTQRKIHSRSGTAWWLVALLVIGGCAKKETTLFELLSPGDTNIDFANTLTPDDSVNILQYVYYYNGGGVAVGDINNDGLKDVFFSGNQVSSKLYLNEGDLSFRDITTTAGVATTRWMTGAAMADVNNDGWLDIYVCAAGSPDPAQRTNMLFINNGDLTFTESAAKYGLDYKGYSTQAAFFDYDIDGDLDLYILNHDHQVHSLNDPKVKRVNGTALSTDRLYQNNNGMFSDVSQQAGITIEGYGLGVSVSDINGDGWPDLYVSNDFVFNDHLYINQRDGTFRNEISSYLRYQSFNAMGNDVADINNDGLVDIMVADMLPEDNKRLKAMMMPSTYDKFRIALQMGYEPQYMRNTLQLNNGDGTFSEIAQLAGVYNTDWSWGPLLADYDNDGNKDLFMANGYLKDMTDMDFIVYRKRNMMFKKGDDAEKALFDAIDKLWGAKTVNYAFQNNGDLTFSDRSAEWGITTPSFSNGASYADLDNDGDLDLVVNNINDKAFIYRNNARSLNDNHYLQLTLKGPAGNPYGYGAKVWLTSASGKTQFLEASPYRGFMSTSDNVLHFGTAADTVMSALKIQWPDGKSQVLANIRSDARIEVDHKHANDSERAEEPAAQPLFQKVGSESGITFVHKEDEYEDFRDEPLIPHKFSQNGPKLASGDINGDGLEDLFVGGSANHSGMLFRQQRDGSFVSAPLEAESPYEDQEALFFDADKDGDADLYVVSGGSEYPAGSRSYQDRLYKNDGKGNFRLDTTALPVMHVSGSCVAACDFDKDGDLDIFSGGRVVPAQYPLTPRSYLLRNDGGRFTDITTKSAETLAEAGMVTDALWADINNDSWDDLVLAGEWMPVTVFENCKGTLVNITSEADLASHTGWWNCIDAADVDNDGDIDFVAGNLGLNSPLKASATEPLTVFAKDFDKNGSVDPIMFSFRQGRSYPFATRDDLVDQVSFLRNRFKTYKQYGETDINNFFKDGELDGSFKLTATDMQSSIIENTGNGKFVVRPLPLKAQIAPVNTILIDDFDGDGNTDILLAGNSYTPHIHTGRYDASYGLVLTGDGKGNFKRVGPASSGFSVKGPAMAMRSVKRSDENLVIVGVNLDSLRVFSYPLYRKRNPLP